MSRATIIADASMCSRTGAAGWAAWGKSDTSLTAKLWSGPLKENPKTADEAELFALANALWSACDSGLITPGMEITIQSDCLVALQRILFRIPGAVLSHHLNSAELTTPKKMKRFSANCEAAITKIKGIVALRGLTLKVRHVRGHKAGDGRQWVNRLCDKHAKKEMRFVREAKSKDVQQCAI